MYFADFIVRLSRMDMSNDMKSNGELLVQKIVLKHAPTTEKTVVFDVGANVGEWTKNLLEKSRVFGRKRTVATTEIQEKDYSNLIPRQFHARKGAGVYFIMVQ